jgi:ABC-type methionine transport system ATPase subunit
MDVAIIDINELSRGQEQKAAIARALAHDPSVLFA